MPSPYYIGDEIALQFDAKDASSAGPDSATVIVYDETNTEVVASTAVDTVSSTTVSHNIAESIIDGAGTYRAVFTCVWSGAITRSHIIIFYVQDSAVRQNRYGSVSRIESWIGDIVPSQVFTSSTTPTYDTVLMILDGVSAEVNIELASQGYAVPVSGKNDPAAYEYLQHCVSAGSAARVLSTRPMESYTLPTNEGTGGDRREMLDRELWHCIQRIRDQRLSASKSSSAAETLFAGSNLDSDGKTNKAIFTRNRFDYPGSRSLIT